MKVYVERGNLVVVISRAELRVLSGALRIVRRDHASVVGRCACIFCERTPRRRKGRR